MPRRARISISCITINRSMESDPIDLVKEQKATQPLWDNVSSPEPSWMMLGASYKGLYSPPGSQSLGNLQDRINLGNTLVDQARADFGLPALSTLPTTNAAGKP